METPITSDDIVRKAVSDYWNEHGFEDDVVAFFYQKYEFESSKEWRFMTEVVFACGQGTMEFSSDFCEGETCVKNLTIVPLDTVLEYYSKSKHLDRCSAEVETYMDDIGGIHSPCDCYNPYGYFCGDCSKLSCKDCKYRDLQPESEDTK